MATQKVELCHVYTSDGNGHDRRISISGYENDFASSSRSRQEVAVVNGKETVLRRTFGKYDNGFQGVGWVEDSDVSQCMICHAEFDRIFLSKHHCRACGNIICHKCSPRKALVCGIEEYGVQRVCTQCHWGQVCTSQKISLFCFSYFFSLLYIATVLVFLMHICPFHVFLCCLMHA
jgi:hypothetical protein